MVSHGPFKRGIMIKKLDRSLELCSSLELYILGSLDLDFFTSLGVDSLTSCPLDHGKGAETDDLNGLLLYRLGDCIENCIKCSVSSGFGGVFAQVFLDGFDELTFIHIVFLLFGRVIY